MTWTRRSLGALRAIGRGLLAPPVIGAAYLLGVVIHAAATPLVSDDASTPGPEARALAEMIVRNYGGEIARFGARLVVVSLAVGAALGALAGGLVALRDRAAGRGARRPLGRAVRALLVTAALHAWALAWTMARKPQPFVDAWYAEKGWSRAVEIVVTDGLGSKAIVALGVAAVAVYVAGSRARMRYWSRRAPTRLARGGVATIAAALAVAGLSSSSCAGRLAGSPAPQASVRDASGIGPDPEPSIIDETRPNVLILAADGFRFDRLVARVAPHLSAVADRGTRFDRAYVAIPHTVPSWITLLTGRDPHHHGVRSIFPRFEERTRELDALPTHLARAGYFTGVVADFAGDSFHDTDLGWATIDAPELNFGKMLCQRALEHTPPILPFLDNSIGTLVFPQVRTINTMSDPRDVESGVIRALHAAGKRPFFLTAFFSTSHFPYAAPAPYYGRFTDPAYRGDFKYHRPIGLANGAEPGPVDTAQINALYDGAIAAVDDAAGRVLAEVERLGLSGRTIVIITSDHGEAIHEHGRGVGHGDHLFGDEVTHVPLAIYDPRQTTPRREAAVVRSADLAPTIYALTGVAPARSLDGRSLAEALTRPIASAPAFAETDLWLGDNPMVPPSLRLPYPGFGGLLEIDTLHGHKIVVRGEYRLLTVIARHRLVRDDRWKLIYAPTPSGARYFLFDTAEDPDEIRDLAAERPAETERLKALLWPWMLQDPELQREGDRLVARPGAERPMGEPGLRIGAP
jgi:arylsulfatase A-like enzyme